MSSAHSVGLTVFAKRVSGAASLLLLPLLAGCAASPPAAEPVAPPDADKRLVAEHAAVTSASPLASEAGVEMLRAGGNAVDAAVATAFAIGVVEPQMSGLGGGGALLLWLQDDRRAEYLDFYAAQDAASFVTPADTEPAGTDLRIVGVPGEVAGLLLALEQFGRLPREQVMAPAIRLAEDGFAINQILAQMIAGDSAKLHRFETTSAAFWPGGRPLAPGALLRNPELAATLRLIAEGGADAFYHGAPARAIVALLNEGEHPATLADFAEYEPRWKRPLCSVYRGRVLLSGPPPQTGSQVMHTLELLEPYDLPALGLPTRSAAAFDVLASALRVGIADNRANDDPRWQPVPANGIASEAFARARSSHVGSRAPAERIEQADATSFDALEAPAACTPFEPYRGEPAALDGPTDLLPLGASVGADPSTDGGETTHISVVDGEGNAVALTRTNSSLFGSGARAAGFFLNDSGYRFEEAPHAPPGLSAWRTRTSTIAPTVVLEDGRVRMVTGAPGGGRIPTAIVQTMVYTLDYGMDPLAALRMPRLFPSPNSRQVQLENGFSAETLRQARGMGWEPTALSFGYARVYSIVRVGERWIAVADPRHDGEPRGW